MIYETVIFCASFLSFLGLSRRGAQSATRVANKSVETVGAVKQITGVTL